ncbi:MAG: hypothetical protein LLG01_07110 [Planctomycetaceae bacterium]|nr:hypothetical protein [Planctomycetaceae bacterium]
MSEITKDSKLTFGKHRGRRLGQCQSDYLEWMAAKLLDTDFHAWALAAKKIIESRKAAGAAEVKLASLEEQADALLRRAGFDSKGQKADGWQDEQEEEEE